MRSDLLAAVAFVGVAGAARADDEKDVRDLAARYAKAAKDKDRAGLERLLRPDYLGDRVPVGEFVGKRELTRSEAVALWTGLGQKHAGLSFTTARVRLYGTTAVETGSLTVSIGQRSGPTAHIFNDVGYTRVWVKGDAGWQLAHESY
jgi:ketosteroid isomerase-like protein